MKKKVLFIIITLIPFITFAEPIEHISKAWELIDTIGYIDTYETDMTYMKYIDSTIMSINKYNGKSKQIKIDNNYYLFNNNHAIVISVENKEATYFTIYDKYLNIESKIKLGDFILDYCFRTNDNEILISGEYINNDSYSRVLIFTDLNGNIIANNEVFTLYKTRIFEERGVSANTAIEDRFVFLDDYNNGYKIINHRIAPINTNSDNTYMIGSNTKVFKYSFDKELIDTLEIPEGKNASIAKKGDYYYVASAILNNKDEKYVYVSLNLYLVDENMEIIKSGVVPYSTYTVARGTEDTNFDAKTFGIINSNGDIYAYVPHLRNDIINTKSYLVHDDLECESPYMNARRPIETGFPFRMEEDKKIDYSSKYPDILAVLIEDGILEKRVSPSGYVSYNGKFSVTEYENNYIVNVTLDKTEPTNDPRILDYYTKLLLIYYDNDLNELFNKEIYDWTLKGEKCGESDQPIVNSVTKVYNDYFVLAANNNQEFFLQVIDKEGNMVKDLSSNLDYSPLSISNIFVNEKGFAVELERMFAFCDLKSGGEAGQAGDGIDDSSLLEKDWYVLAYFSYPYLIKTNVNGEGNITVSYDKAMEGTEIEFTVEPKEGYVLGEVKVTDANGNILTFTDYTFTMPSSDVLIEVTFVKAAINPNTKTFAIEVLILLGISSLVVLYSIKKKEIYL